jgi:hypothetical protein
VSR